jgi:uncharacterized protein
MIIREMSKDECLHLITRVRLARLACALNDQPYVVPVFLAYHEPSAGESCFYGFTTLGQKVEWMRANPQVCVEVDEVTSCTRWLSVVAFGHYEELPDERECNVRHLPARRATAHHHDIVVDEVSHAAERLLAYQLLQSHAAWWEPMPLGRPVGCRRLNPLEVASNKRTLLRLRANTKNSSGSPIAGRSCLM